MEQTVKEKELLFLKPDQIEVEKEFNVRRAKNYGDIDSLAESIVLIGLQQPLQGFKKGNKYILTDGHRRFKAIQLAIEKNKAGDETFKDLTNIKKIDFLLGSSDMESRLLTMLTTGEGKKALDDGEKRVVFAKLIKFGEKANKSKRDIVKELCKMTNSSQAHIYSILALNEMPKEVQKEVDKGALSANTAGHLSRQVGGDEKKLVAVVKKTIDKAKERAKKEGKSEKDVKATVSDTKGLVAGQTPYQRVKELLEELSIEQVNTDKAKFFRIIIQHVENKMPTKQLLKLFKE